MDSDKSRLTAEIELSELRRIRDQLARLRHESHMNLRLFQQVAGLYQRLEQQAKEKQET